MAKDEIIEQLKSLKGKRLFGSEVEKLIEPFKGKVHSFDMIFAESERSFGSQSDPAYENGHKMKCQIPEGPEITVLVPADQEEFINGIKPGDNFNLPLQFLGYDGLYHRAVFGKVSHKEEIPNEEQLTESIEETPIPPTEEKATESQPKSEEGISGDKEKKTRSLSFPKSSERTKKSSRTAKTESAITLEIWNPERVGVLSLLLTPIWGSILLSKNWKSLNCPERARKVNVWGWIWLIVLITYLFVVANFLENVINILIIPLLIIWYLKFVQEQVNYLKNNNISYDKKGLLNPIMKGIAVPIVLGYVLALLEDQAIEKHATSKMTEIIQELTNNSDFYCESVTIGDWITGETYRGTATLSDGNSLRINITLRGNEVSIKVKEKYPK